MEQMEIAARLKKYIKVTGRKQSAVAESVGLSVQTFNSILNGKTSLKADVLMKALAFMQISPDSFFAFQFPETRKEVS